MLIVLKYGGTSLEDSRCQLRAAGQIGQLTEQGHKVVTVVSAQGQTTDGMIEHAARVNPKPSVREIDAYLASGEQMSAALLAMAVERIGVPAVSLTGWQAGIRTDGHFSDAQIMDVCAERISRELSEGKTVIVAGFQGIDQEGNITTLGRGGSDTTAVALAAALEADICRIYTDVDGVYDRDPRKFPDAARYEKIGYGPMLELIRRGAQVLHDRCVEYARKYGILLEVRSSFTDQPGTVVGDLE